MEGRVIQLMAIVLVWMNGKARLVTSVSKLYNIAVIHMSESHITKQVTSLYSCYRGVFKGKFIPREREVYKSVSRAARGSHVAMLAACKLGDDKLVRCFCDCFWWPRNAIGHEICWRKDFEVIWFVSFK